MCHCICGWPDDTLLALCFCVCTTALAYCGRTSVLSAVDRFCNHNPCTYAIAVRHASVQHGGGWEEISLMSASVFRSCYCPSAVAVAFTWVFIAK
jgi:hypothetical protein